MLTVNNISERLLKAQYAVRGPIVSRAQQLEEQGKKIIYCNIGNPQALKQRPITYLRQILSLVEYPELLDTPQGKSLFPSDVVEKVRTMFARYPFGTGAYSQSMGIPFIREAIAEFIQRRDGVTADKEHIILTDGASKAAQAVILALQKSEHDGLMIPIPQYPLYSATIELHGGKQIGYILDEANHWQLSERVVEERIAEAQRDGIHPVAIVVINPGNPTGAVLSYENIAMVVNFARRHKLSILADEVYQDNVYDQGSKFYSFAKVMNDMHETGISLFSYNSVSKGFLGECGHRGGYIEFRNIPNDVVAQFEKFFSISLCANLPGQFATYVMVAPPQPGEESYNLYQRERQIVLDSLKKKAQILTQGINLIKGMSIALPHGAMYAFVRFTLPVEKGVYPDSMTPEERYVYEEKRDTEYCLTLLEETGICVIPGSGFGHLPGTLHFRTTFLPPVEEIETFIVKLKEFHERYVTRW
ncbi:MAG: aminotransferase class I/II-fold pyridoxal phosphate-dependent enzyme [Bacteroidota bacterium]